MRVADTVGIATPQQVTSLVTEVRRVYGGEIGVHLHNDFGMATAGAVRTTDMTLYDAGGAHVDTRE